MNKIETLKHLDDTQRQRETIETLGQLQRQISQFNLNTQIQPLIDHLNQSLLQLQRMDFSERMEPLLDNLAAAMEPVVEALITLNEESSQHIKQMQQAWTVAADQSASKINEANSRAEKIVIKLESDLRSLRDLSTDLSNTSKTARSASEEVKASMKHLRMRFISGVVLTGIATGGLSTVLLLLWLRH